MRHPQNSLNSFFLSHNIPLSILWEPLPISPVPIRALPSLNANSFALIFYQKACPITGPTLPLYFDPYPSPRPTPGLDSAFMATLLWAVPRPTLSPYSHGNLAFLSFEMSHEDNPSAMGLHSELHEICESLPLQQATHTDFLVLSRPVATLSFKVAFAQSSDALQWI